MSSIEEMELAYQEKLARNKRNAEEHSVKSVVKKASRIDASTGSVLDDSVPSKYDGVFPIRRKKKALLFNDPRFNKLRK